MNNQRRKEIAAVIDKLGDLEALVNDIKDLVEQIKDEEQEYYDNMPEGLQVSDRGYQAEAAVDALDEALMSLDDFRIEDIISNLETAAE